MYDIWVTGEHNPIIIGRDRDEPDHRHGDPGPDAPSAWVTRVHPRCRDRLKPPRQGTRQALAEKLVERARLRLTSLELTSSDDRAAALNLYDSLGFKLRETNVLTLSLTA